MSIKHIRRWRRGPGEQWGPEEAHTIAYPSVPRLYRSSKEGSNNKVRWRMARHSTDIVVSPYKRDMVWIESGTGSVSAYGQYYDLEDSFEGTFPVLSNLQYWEGHLMSVMNEELVVQRDVVTRAVARAREAEWDILTSLGEAPETIRMVRDLLRDALHASRRVRTAIAERSVKQKATRPKKGKRISRARAAVDKTTETWMLWRYGVMPVAYELEDAANALNKVLAVFSTERVRAQTGRDVTVWTGALGPSGVPRASLYGRIQLQYTVNHRCFLKGCYHPLAEHRRRFGINPLVTAWELTRLSFVVDWFLQVGDALQALSRSLAAQEVSTYSRQRKARLVWVPDERQPDVEFYNSLQYGGSLSLTIPPIVATATSYDRVVIDPASHLTIPKGTGLNWKRELDSFSLIWPALRDQFTRLKK